VHDSLAEAGRGNLDAVEARRQRCLEVDSSLVGGQVLGSTGLFTDDLDRGARNHGAGLICDRAAQRPGDNDLRGEQARGHAHHEEQQANRVVPHKTP